MANLPATLADKIALANTLAAYLDGTNLDLATELNDRNVNALLFDADFRRVLDERATRCPECKGWVAADANCDCGIDDDWDDFE